jgi:glutathione-independent formaldehyde dehydrogenase
MRAVVYKGPRDVAVKNVPDASIDEPTDVVVKMGSIARGRDR